MMKALTLLFGFICLASSSFAAKSILIFYKTAGYHHQSIKEGKELFLHLAKERKLKIDTTANATIFTDAELKKYSCIVFLNTTGDILNDDQQKSFQNYIHHGGSFLGIHAATDTEMNWDWYNHLVGAFFKDHPKPQQASYHLIDNKFPATKFIKQDTFSRFEEMYNFRNFQNEELHVLITLDESTYEGGNMGQYHPFTWYHQFEGGKSFYTGFGHHGQTYADPFFIKLINGALDWLIS